MTSCYLRRKALRFNFLKGLGLALVLLGGAPVDAKLLLRCDFETITGNQTDCVNHLGAPNGTITATVFGSPTTTTGRTSLSAGSTNAIVFDGTDDYVAISGSPDLIGEPGFTVEAWVKVAAQSINVFRVQQPVLLHTDGFRVAKSTGWHPRLDAANAPPTNEWYHLAGVFDRGELRIYVNGRLANVDTFGTDDFGTLHSSTSYTDWGIGARIVSGSPDQFFTGLIDEISVYDEPLAAIQIFEHAMDASSVPVINVKSDPYYAEGDGATNDTAAIQSALDAAGSMGAEVLLPSGIYLLDDTLEVPSGVLVRGEAGTILKPKSDSEDDVSPVFLFSGVQDSTLRDLEIQGFSSGLSQDSGHSGIFLQGTERVHIDRVIIQDLGRDIPGMEPGGTHILVTGLGSETDSVRNVIENCVLDDSRRITNFGIRFKTEWKDIDPEDIEVEIRESVVKNNLLEGFLQAIEIAGPGTKNNWIRGNLSKGAEESGIEADKGADYNTFLDNHIRLSRSNTNALVAGMRDQGTFWCDGTTLVYELFNEGNVFRRNLIADIWNQKNAGGILLGRSTNVIFEDNYVRDVRAGNSADAALVLRAPSSVTSPMIIDNKMSEVPNLEVVLPATTPCP